MRDEMAPYAGGILVRGAGGIPDGAFYADYPERMDGAAVIFIKKFSKRAECMYNSYLKKD